MKKVDFNKLQAGDLVEVPRTQFAPMRRGWNGWLFSEAVVIRKGVGRKSKKNVVVGYLAAFKPFADHEISEEYRKYSGHEVKKFRAVPEITHRRWKELGLMKPLEPDQTAQYKFSDLQMSLYYTIYI